MAERQPEAVGRGLDDFGLQRHAVAQVGDDHDGDVEFAADQQVFEIAAIVLDGADLDAGAGAAIAGQQVGEHVAGDQRGDADIERAAGRVPLARKSWCAHRRRSRRIFVAWRRNWWPLWVMDRPRGWRSNSSTPRSFSSSLMASVIEDCEIDRFCAARVMEPCSATATKY